MSDSDDNNSILANRSKTRRVSTSRQNLVTNGQYLTTPPKPDDNLYKRALMTNWRANGSLERFQDQLLSISPIQHLAKSINRRSSLSQRTLNFNADCLPRSSKSASNVLEETDISEEIVWLVEPITTISKQHARMDPICDTMKLIYRVFFCSATLANIDKIEEDISLLKEIDAYSEAKFQDGTRLFEVTTFNVLIGQGVICVVRTSEFKPSIGPEAYKFTDNRVIRSVCRALISKNLNESSRLAKSLTIRSSYESLKDSRNQPFKLNETIELVFGDSLETPGMETFEESNHSTNRLESPVLFREKINAYQDKKFQVHRAVQFIYPKTCELMFERIWYGKTKIHLSKNELESSPLRSRPNEANSELDDKSQAAEKRNEDDSLVTAAEIDLTNILRHSDLTPIPAFNETDQPPQLSDYSTDAEWSKDEPTQDNAIETSPLRSSANEANSELDDKSQVAEKRNEDDSLVMAAEIDLTSILRYNDVTPKPPFDEDDQPTTLSDAELSQDEKTQDSADTAIDSSPIHLSINMPDSEPDDKSQRSMHASQSFDLTNNAKKPVYTHTKLVRLGTIMDRSKAAINLNLTVRSNRPVLDFKMMELSVDGELIWKNPKNNTNQED